MGQEETRGAAPDARTAPEPSGCGRAAVRATGRAPENGAEHGAGPEVAGAQRHVLVIEDEPNISEAIRFILQRDGLRVTVLPGGEAALGAIVRLRPDVVILDVMLPGVSGFEILEQLRATPALADLPVILLTANGQPAAREKAAQHGASLFMAKPFSNAELLRAVRALVA